MMSIYYDQARKKKEMDKLLGELKSEGTASLAKCLYAAGLPLVTFVMVSV